MVLSSKHTGFSNEFAQTNDKILALFFHKIRRGKFHENCINNSYGQAKNHPNISSFLMVSFSQDRTLVFLLHFIFKDFLY